MQSSLLSFAGIFGLGGPELFLIFGVVVLLFGATKLPELAKGLGKSIKEFKKASAEADEEIASAKTETKAPAKTETTKTGAN